MNKDDFVNKLMGTAKRVMKLTCGEFEDWVEQRHKPLARAHNKMVDRVAGLEARIAALEARDVPSPPGE